MPVTLEDIEAQRKRVQEAGAKSTRLAGVGSSFMAQVMEELRQRSAEKGRGVLAEQAKRTREEWGAVGPRLREEYKEIDPFRRMTLIGQRKGQLLGELGDIAGMREKREAGVSDILGLIQSGIQAQAERESARAAQEQQLYQNIWQEYQFAQQQALNYAKLQQQGVGGGLTPYQKWQIGRYYEEKAAPPELPASARSEAADYMHLIDDLNRIKGTLGGREPGVSGYLKGLIGGPTGRVVGHFGEWYPGADIRTGLATLRADVEHAVYGAALTETEIERAKTWVPSPTAAEVTNVRRLDEMITKKQNELLNLLKAHGQPEDIIQQFMGGGGGRPPLSSFER